MKHRRLRQMLTLGCVAVLVPAAMAIGVVVGDIAAPISSALADPGVSASNNDNDVFAASHLAGRFETFSGSLRNAQSLITGLRNGSKIRLVAGDERHSFIGLMFTPPTRSMSYGEIDRTLSLAQAQLANRGITNPTPEQLQIALMGGCIGDGEKTVGTTGVLPLRSQGMGWGQIALALSLDEHEHSDAKPRITRAPQALSEYDEIIAIANTGHDELVINY